MTNKRDLKRRVRERKERTGESYVTALKQVRAKQPAPVPVVELIDLNVEARELGFQCRACMVPELAARVDGAVALARLREALVVTRDDPALETLRAVALRGEPVRTGPAAFFADTQRFIHRARAGIGGALYGGQLLTLEVPGRAGGMVQVVFVLYPKSRAIPVLMLSSAESGSLDPLIGFIMHRK